ncbi:MAG: bifunctional hydroxymethylpyrimidine kinase/phosphomethylpyrimidine kinase [Halomonas sp.]|jgi:hydroxymethylpyrimidine/phosphomethylpyrimidine kinase|uniref:hydroxymethylpyrimidine kinase n=1 Tax=Billgrantia tianxiuensis TaxID=2497861 RepID=A0A6I6SPJ2_9GAMM|nr:MULTISPECIES: bifunctional hydroxymethylpyrimidine kinase/phosphomethylpyrimidine kinase [Halomonas]MCE8035406.1 bifunctional hydroxymethylpyrimidine kinase/phosphomethylpyrimidine kinase [Halomonas sp. MCCC 1A11057]MDX5432428.1 bifunctional hydroxymethylpyrimidine kinase/phosphomethylpyrimidine kinase [Halomonas sp.]MDX5502174.1 bifunctional hydroxymethylpyrimidine kinase/phosphomethylpyrimidine kinase [Halomonas sp.]QHC51802.1 bifunctional hydroxymethylpyrimidine kinase/phosphomethylpyrimi
MTNDRPIPNVLTIAGSDPSGGAGIQADLKTFSALGAYGTSVVTALTAQNTCGVRGVYPMPVEFIRLQLDTLLDDVEIDAVKIGMVASREVAEALRDTLEARRPRWIVLDPVMVAKSGDILVDDVGIAAVREVLVPLADLITPNLPEAAVLLGDAAPRTRDEMAAMAPRLAALRAGATLLKGGHLSGESCPDLLIENDVSQWIEGTRIGTSNLHGTGCSLSSAIAARLALGDTLTQAVAAAKQWLEVALTESRRLDVGRGHGPVHHFHRWW